MTADDMSDAPRVFHVSLARDSLLRGPSGERVVLSHFVDSLGALTIVTGENGEVRRRSLQEVLAEHAAYLRMTNPNISPDRNTELLNWISPEKRRKAREMECHILDVRHGRAPETVNGKVDSRYDPETTTPAQRRKAKREELGISDDRIGRLLNRYPNGGAISLLDHVTRPLVANGAAGVAPEILALVREINRGRPRSSKKHLVNEHAAALAELRRRGLVSKTRGTPAPGGGVLPLETEALSYDTYVKLTRYLDRGRDPLTAKTRQQQDNRPIVRDVRHRGYDLGDRVEMDSTLTDIHVWGPDGPQRLWAVFAVCVSTRYLWMRFVPGPPRGIHLALLLWDMMGGDTFMVDDREGELYTLPAVPSEIDVNLWLAKGAPPAVLPGCIALDHGAEEENGYFLAFAAQLGIRVNWAKTLTPTDKAYVESHIKKFASFCQHLPGHKGNTVDNRPYKLDTDLLTFAQVQAAGRVWTQWAAAQPGTGLTHDLAAQHHLSAIEAVGMSLARGAEIGMCADPTLPLRLLPHLSLTPQDDGVPWQKRRYTCPDFEDIIEVSAARGRRRPLTFFYDPDNPGRLYWPVPGTFKVRTLHSPGSASGATGAFAEVRQQMLKSLSGRRWPSHNATAASRADLIELLTATWEKDGLTENVVPITRVTKRRKRPAKGRRSAADAIVNGGWDLEGFEDLLDRIGDDFADPDSTDDPDTTSPW